MSNFLLILAELSIAAAIFYGIYHLSMKVFKKRITKQCRYILCLLVVFRMLIPFGMNIEIPWDSVGEKIFGPAPEKAADVVTFKENVPEDTYEETFLGVRIENDARENSYEALADEPIIGTPQENKEDLFTAGVVSRNTVGSQEISMHAPVEDQSKLSSIFGRWETLVFSLWLLGAIVSFIYYEAGYLRWKRMILSGCRPAELEDDELLEQMYPNGYVDVLQSNQVSTPLLCGAICPYLILPEGGFVKNGRQSTLEHIFRHEMYHVKRQDLIWKHFAILAQSVHWFNPFLHSICKELSRCCELSCDEAVTKEMEMQDVRAYGETILTLASGTFA